jgi:phytoene dehydrogenase-like protein
MKHVVIIGGGLGGLTSGAMLAKDGYRVTVLEQHVLPGGCATTFRRKGGYRCEVGLHEMDGVYSSETVQGVFDYLDVYKNMEFVKPNEFFSHQSDRLSFDMPENVLDARSRLIERYPQEEKGIEQYFALIKVLHDQIEKIQKARWWEMALAPMIFFPLFRYSRTSVKEIMEKFFEDEELKLLLNTNVQYYHNKISELSILFHSVAQYSFYNGGGYFIKGGSQILSDHLVSIIKQHGGEVILGANVTSMETEAKRVASVTYERREASHTLSADLVISNIAPAPTYALADVAYEETKDTSVSLLSIYIGFKHDLKSVYGQNPYTTFFFKEIDTIEKYDHFNGSLEEQGFVFTDYSQIDSGLTPEGKSFGVMCSVDSLEEWEGLDEETYKAKKARIADRYLDALSQTYPDIREHIEFVEVGTARTMQHYLKTPGGTAYGFAPTTQQAFRIPQVHSKRLRNLYFASSWVIGGGFSAAIIAASMCRDVILKKER